jgi:hypothetical protein
MFLHEVDLRQRESQIQGPHGIAALAVDPGSDLDVCRLGGKSLLRPGGLWLPSGRVPGNLPISRVRETGGLDVPECSIITLQVFEPGDLIVAPPKRVSKVYEKRDVALVAGAPTSSYIGLAVPFTGRRAMRVSVMGPSGSVATVYPIGVCLDSAGAEHLLVLSGTEAAPTAGDTFATAAAGFSGHSLIDGLIGQSRYYGGTDSLEMCDEVVFMASGDVTGNYQFLVEVSDEVNG